MIDQYSADNEAYTLEPCAKMIMNQNVQHVLSCITFFSMLASIFFQY